MIKYTVEAGEVYGFWTVLVPLPGYSYCRCKCGVQKKVRNTGLIKGLSIQCRACGYAGRVKYPQTARLVSLRNKAKNAVERCTNPEHSKFHHYGGRGISIYQPWVENLVEFVEYLMTLDGWDDPRLVLDRVDNGGNYEPGNLRFVTVSESMKNRRRWGKSPSTLARWRRLGR